MKQIYLILITLLWFTGSTFAQRTCGNELSFSEIRKNDPKRYQRIMQIERHTRNYIQQKEEGVSTMSHGGLHVVIPVVVHVLHNGEAIGSGLNISVAQIESQIDVLNEDFRRLNADAGNTPLEFQGVAADAGIEFLLACIDPNGNPTNGIIRQQTTVTTFNSDTDNIKFASQGGSDAWPAARYLNIWVGGRIETPGGDELLGYAQFPDQLATSPETDGVVIRTTAFGRIGNVVAPFDEGRTATHEIGHWLNLIHIWGDDNGACTETDHVADTPNQGNFYFDCPTHPQASCNSNDMFMNYMDYTDDGCMNIFTEGQANRMLALFAVGGERESFVGCSFIADACEVPPFISGPRVVCTSETFTINNVPPNSDFVWSTSTHLSIQSTSGNSVDVNKAVKGNGWVRCTITPINCPDPPLVLTYSVRVGPETADFYISAYPDCSSPGYVIDFVAEINDVNYSWTVNGGTLLGGQGTKAIWARMDDLSMAVHCYVTGTSPADCFSPEGISSVYINECYEFSALSVSPNPASNSLTIELDEPEENKPVGIELRNNFGETVKSFIEYKNKLEINIESLPKGLYILKVTYDGQIFNRRILIEK